MADAPPPDCRFACAAFPNCGCTVEALSPPPTCPVQFMKCQEPSETVFAGVRCVTCGHLVSAQEWDQIEKEIAARV